MRLSSPNVNLSLHEYGQNPRRHSRDGGFVQVRAFSKINLFLEVLERRADNYHNLRSLMQSVSLHDVITIRTTCCASNEDANCSVTCLHPTLPVDDRNIVTRVAKYMLSTFDMPHCHINIEIDKHIPVSAGLGGGSSDCAAVMVGMNQLFNLQLTPHILKKIGSRFGADVPFCIEGGTQLAEGVGEKLTPLTPFPPCFIVLACLPISVSTAKIFNEYAKMREAIPTDALIGDCINPLIQSTEKQDLHQIVKYLHNDLTRVTTKKHPEITHLINQMKELGALNAAMSGSGPSVFGIFECEQTANAASDMLKQTIRDVFITQPERMRVI